MKTEMMDQHGVGLRREVLAIMAVLLCTLLNGYITGFSAVAIPDIKKDMRWRLVECLQSLREHDMLQEQLFLHRFTHHQCHR